MVAQSLEVSHSLFWSQSDSTTFLQTGCQLIVFWLLSYKTGRLLRANVIVSQNFPLMWIFIYVDSNSIFNNCSKLIVLLSQTDCIKLPASPHSVAEWYQTDIRLTPSMAGFSDSVGLLDNYILLQKITEVSVSYWMKQILTQFNFQDIVCCWNRWQIAINVLAIPSISQNVKNRSNIIWWGICWVPPLMYTYLLVVQNRLNTHNCFLETKTEQNTVTVINAESTNQCVTSL